MWGCAELQVCVAAATSSRGLDPTCTCGKCRASKVVLTLKDAWHCENHSAFTAFAAGLSRSYFGTLRSRLYVFTPIQ